jgi:NAD+ kinase
VLRPFTLGRKSGRPSVGVLVTPSGRAEPEVVMIEAWARRHGVEPVRLGTSAQPSELPESCELIVALGGDGTILRALHLAMTDEAAVLGVNFGTVGFLADVHGDDLRAALERISSGEAQLDERTALAATMYTDEPRRIIAFNDVVIARRPGFGTARVHIDVSGEPMLALKGDGVVIASPTGSTAYTIGAGGPAVTPTLDAIVVTPLATQGSPIRSLVVDGRDAIRISTAPSSAPLRVEVDGRNIHEMPATARLEICAAPRRARFVRTRPRTFYRDLAELL